MRAHTLLSTCVALLTCVASTCVAQTTTFDLGNGMSTTYGPGGQSSTTTDLGGGMAITRDSGGRSSTTTNLGGGIYITNPGYPQPVMVPQPSPWR